MLFREISENSSVSTVTRLLSRWPESGDSIPGRGMGFFSFPRRPDRLWAYPAPYLKGTEREASFLDGKSAGNVKLTTSASPYVLVVSYLYLSKRRVMNLYSQHYNKPINTLLGQNADIWILTQAAHMVNTVFWKVKHKTNGSAHCEAIVWETTFRAR
jgi:hypothetical protein